jgi:hypothetical protein
MRRANHRRHPAMRALRVVLGLLVAASFLEGAPSGAQAAGALGGYQGSAAASGVHAFYNLGNILPTPPPVDLSVPDALATIASGPATFARASVADPGDLLANPDVVLSLASSAYPAGTLPAYPYRISATSGAGSPTAEVSPVPGLAARVEATDKGSRANATLPVVDAPAIATFGTVTATATTETDGSKVTVHARTQTSGFNALGVLEIDSITTDLTATSDGTDTKLSGGTTIAGASLAGTPITIDRTGIHQAGAADPVLGAVLGGVTSTLDALLRQLGVTITLSGPVKLDGGTGGQLASAGLKVDLELSDRTLPGLAALIDAIPPIDNPLPGAPGIEDVLTIAKAKHLVSIEVGRGSVSLAARPAFEAVGAPTTPSSSVLTDGSFQVPSTSPSVDLPALTTVPRPSSPGGLRPVGTDVPIPAGAGIGSLVLLALLAVPFIGDRLGAVANTILTANHTEPCAWEEP